MSNGQVYATAEFSIQRKTGMKERLRRWVRNFIFKEDDNTVAHAPIVAPGNSKFNGEFDGWNFRMHRANGGHVIEAWRYNHRPNKHTGSTDNDHELFLITSDEDIHKELPHILTQLALR
jgi:hypothetical protein